MPGEFEDPRKLGLFEYAGEMEIGEEGIDANGHLSHTKYFPMYELQRGLYVAACGITVQDMRERLKVRPILRRFGGDFIKELLSGDHITIHTAAQDEISHIKFLQYIMRENTLAANFWCTVYTPHETEGARRIPQELREVINQANQSH